MNIKNLKVGEEFYVVDKYVGLDKPIIRTFKVTERKEWISKLDNTPQIKVTAYCNNQNFYQHYYDYVGQSLAKAQKVLIHKRRKYENYLEKRKQEKLNYQINEENIEEAKLKYLDKDVMIKWKSYPENKTKYVKSTITHVFSTDKKGVYALSCRGYNVYLTSREGKNWYFWTREKELIEQRNKINQELAKIRRANSEK